MDWLYEVDRCSIANGHAGADHDAAHLRLLVDME